MITHEENNSELVPLYYHCLKNTYDEVTSLYFSYKDETDSVCLKCLPDSTIYGRFLYRSVSTPNDVKARVQALDYSKLTNIVDLLREGLELATLDSTAQYDIRILTIKDDLDSMVVDLPENPEFQQKNKVISMFPDNAQDLIDGFPTRILISLYFPQGVITNSKREKMEMDDVYFYTFIDINIDHESNMRVGKTTYCIARGSLTSAELYYHRLHPHVTGFTIPDYVLQDLDLSKTHVLPGELCLGDGELYKLKITLNGLFDSLNSSEITSLGFNLPFLAEAFCYWESREGSSFTTLHDMLSYNTQLSKSIEGAKPPEAILNYNNSSDIDSVPYVVLLHPKIKEFLFIERDILQYKELLFVNPTVFSRFIYANIILLLVESFSTVVEYDEVSNCTIIRFTPGTPPETSLINKALTCQYLYTLLNYGCLAGTPSPLSILTNTLFQTSMLNVATNNMWRVFNSSALQSTKSLLAQKTLHPVKFKQEVIPVKVIAKDVNESMQESPVLLPKAFKPIELKVLPYRLAKILFSMNFNRNAQLTTTELSNTYQEDIPFALPTENLHRMLFDYACVIIPDGNYEIKDLITTHFYK